MSTKLDLTPNTAPWLDARKKYRTASELPIVMGISPFTTPQKFKLIKAGVAKQFYSAAMQLGHTTEATTRHWAESVLNRSFSEEVWVNGEYLASLDGYHADSGTVLEIKCSQRTYNDIEAGVVPPYYLWQIQQQLYCCGGEVAYLAAYCPKTNRYLLSEPIWPNESFLEHANAAWDTFNAMPMPEGPIDASDDLDLVRLFDSYSSLKSEIESLETLLAAKRDEILTYKAPDRSVTCRGYEITWRAGAKKTDYRKAATDAKLDLSKYISQGEPTYALKMAAPPFSPDTDE